MKSTPETTSRALRKFVRKVLSKSLFKPKEQYKPLTRGQLDMTVFPLPYAGGQQPAYNLT